MDKKIEDIALRDRVGKPQVTEEWVNKWATRWKNVDCYYEVAVRQMLKELGIEVVD